MAVEWLTAILPFIRDSKQADILREHVNLLEAQRDDAIRELDKADEELVAARARIAVLEEAAAANLKSAQAKPILKEDAVKVLQYFFSEERPITVDQIIGKFGFATGIAKHHIDMLRRHKFIELGGGMIINMNGPLRFVITPLGREYLVDHGLVG